jgi:hypothetical protein
VLPLVVLLSFRIVLVYQVMATVVVVAALACAWTSMAWDSLVRATRCPFVFLR